MNTTKGFSVPFVVVLSVLIVATVFVLLRFYGVNSFGRRESADQTVPISPTQQDIFSLNNENMVTPTYVNDVGSAEFNLGGINLILKSTFFPRGIFYLPEPDAPQLASVSNFVNGDNGEGVFEELSLNTGVIRQSLLGEVSSSTSAESAYQSTLQYRLESAVSVKEGGPTALLFGKEVKPIVSLTNMNSPAGKTENDYIVPMLILEWVTEYKGRTWILRSALKLDEGTTILPSDEELSQMHKVLELSEI